MDKYNSPSNLKKDELIVIERSLFTDKSYEITYNFAPNPQDPAKSSYLEAIVEEIKDNGE